jgi:hypothetical protein
MCSIAMGIFVNILEFIPHLTNFLALTFPRRVYRAQENESWIILILSLGYSPKRIVSPTMLIGSCFHMVVSVSNSSSFIGNSSFWQRLGHFL